MPRERFRVECVRIQGITSHVDTRLSLPPGSLALVGDNGTGKSSLLEAIHLALTLKPWRTQQAGELVRVGSPQGRVTVVLAGDRGTRVELHVTVHAHGQKRRSAQLKVNGKVRASQVTAYLHEVARLLGFRDHKELVKLVGHAVLVRQGGLRQIVEAMADPREFGEMLEKVVGVPEYREAAQKLAQVDLAADLDGVRGSWSPPSKPDPKASRYRKLAAALQEARERIEEARRVREEALAAEKRASEEAARLEAELEEARARLTRLEQAAARLNELEEQRKTLTARARARAAQLEDLREQLARAEKMVESLEKLARLAHLAPLVDELARLEAKLAEARARADKLEDLVKALEEAAGLEEAEEALARALKKIEELEAAIAEARRRLQEVERALGALEAAARQVEDAARAAARLLEEAPSDPRKLLEALESEIARLAAAIEDLRRAADEARERAAKARAEAEAAEKALSALRASRESARCPVCRSPLSPEARSRLEAELEEKARAAKSLGARALEEAERLAREARGLEERLRRLEAAAETLRSALASYDPGELERLRALKARLESELEVLEAETAGLREEAKRLSAEIEMKRARLAHARTAASKLGLARLPGLEEARAMLSSALQEVATLEAELDSVKERLLGEAGYDTLEEAVKAVRDAVEAARKLESHKAMIAALRGRMEALEEEVRSLTEDLENVTKRIEEARREAEGLGDARALADRLEKELRAAREEAAAARARAEAADSELKEAQAELKGLSRVRERMEAAMAAAFVLSDTVEALMGEAIAHLNNAVNDVLSKFDLDYVSVDMRRVDGGVAVSAVSRSLGRSVPVGLVSGGESAAIALAYVLGLQRILSAGIDFLALDEPTSDLDEDRRGVLLDVLGGAVGEAGVRQLLVVTHHDEVVDRVDSVCRLRKEGGMTRVSRPDGSPCPTC